MTGEERVELDIDPAKAQQLADEIEADWQRCKAWADEHMPGWDIPLPADE